MSGTREDGCETSISACYYIVLQSFFAGADGVADYLDVLFGIIIIVVLLNVVIAIVEQAWAKAADVTMRLFWMYRLEFLTENRIFKKSNRFKVLNKLKDWIDGVPDIKYTDRTKWAKYPFNLVNTKEKYENPDGYFNAELSRQIKETRSCQASLYWVEVEHYDRQKVVGDSTDNSLELLSNSTKLFWGRISILTEFFFQLTLYTLLTFLGIFTCGWFWPRGLRRKILSVGLSGED